MEKIKQKHLIDTLFHLLEQTPHDVSEYHQKWIELMEKSKDRRLHITFTGHFSAGKSTLLNHLVHGNVLPSSPLPTSSNVVLLGKGPSKVKATDYKGNAYVWEGDIEPSFIQSLCKRGDVLQTVSIENDDFQLDSNMVLMDSPGIDSTDDDHRKSTESALHFGDIVVYVTDYHHVQSELNLSFIQKLNEMKKELLVIVNQIDKHHEEEIAFDVFKQRIEESMLSVGVKKENIFYTTLKNPTHPYNEFDRLKKKINEYLLKKDDLIEQNIIQSSRELIQEITNEKLNHFVESENIAIEDVQTAEQQVKELQRTYELLENDLNHLNDEKKKLAESFEYELTQLLKNANLTPFSMREKAKKFLTVEDPSFKVGLFFSKKKTEMAKKDAEDAFLNEINSLIESEVVWHLRNFSKAIYEKFAIQSGELLEEILSLQFAMTIDDVKKLIKHGASVNEQYVLNYSKDVADFIKREMKKIGLSILTKLKERQHEQLRDQLKEVETKMDHITKTIVMKSKWFEEYEKLISWQQKMLQVLQDGFTHDSFSVIDWLEERKEKYTSFMEKGQIPEFMNDIKQEEMTELADVTEHRTEENEETPSEMVRQLQTIADILVPIEEATYLRNRLLQRSETMANRSYTIAMFGAFSAGKSSFANAVVGEKIFPSSPNPTTAVINKLTGVKEPYKHGDVSIRYKDEKDLLDEINDLLKPYELQINQLQEVSRLKETVQEENSLLQRLAIYEKGVSFWLQKSSLNEVIGLDEMEEYVANEEKSCVIKEATIYYDCELTKKGITLVDTPGASSLHQRHTDLAFQYIKESDAIIFLTYFNHPFSKADQQFLHQLGLVKDSFSLDKMFFIVNAIDLAENESEAQTVKEYVKEMLWKHSIRNPKLFSVSSLASLTNKSLSHVNNEMKAFEQAFAQFIEHDLTHMMVQTAKKEIEATIQQVKEYIALSQLGEAERKQKLLELQEAEKTSQQMISKTDMKDAIIQMKQEVTELFHYVKQRLVFGMSDLFKEAYEPSKFVDPKQPTKQVLNDCFHEFIQSLNTSFIQEYNATSLRVETYINKLLDHAYKQLSDKITQLLPTIPLKSRDDFSIETPSWEETLMTYVPQSVEKGHKFFKNTKAFFEHNEKQKLFNTFEEWLPEVFDALIQKAKEHFHREYEKAITSEWEAIQQMVRRDVEEYISSRTKSLKQPKNTAELEQILHEIKREAHMN